MTRLESPAFSTPFKLLAVLIVTLALAWAAQMWVRGLIAFTLESSGWLGAALCMMAYTEWHILRSKTSLDAIALQQTWVWQKRVALSQLAYAKLIRVRGLEWLIAPRLYTRTASNQITVFYASSAEMLQEFARLEKETRA